MPAICVLNRQLAYTYFNKKYQAFTLANFEFKPKVGAGFLSKMEDQFSIKDFSVKLDQVLSGIPFKHQKKSDRQNTTFSCVFRPLQETDEITGIIIEIESQQADVEVNRSHLLEEVLAKESVGTWEMDLESGEMYFSGFWSKYMKDGKIDHIDEKDHFLSLIHSEDLSKFQEFYDLARFSKESHFHIKFRVKIGDRKYRWISNSTSVEFDSRSKPSRLISMCRDITYEKELEVKWQEEESLLREIERIAHLGHYEYNFKTDSWTSSVELNKIIGINRSYPHNLQGWLDLVHPLEREEIQQYFLNEVVGKKKRFDKVYRVVNAKSKEPLYVHGKGRLIFDDHNKPILMIGTIQDVTKTLEKNRELMHMSKFAEYTQSGLLVTDTEGVTTWVHPSMKVISGHSQEEMIGKTPGEVLQGPNTNPEHIKAFTRGLATKKPFAQEILNYKKDGSLLWNEVQITPILDKEGNVREFLGVQVDITERKQIEEELALSEYRLRTISNNLPGMIFRFALQADGYGQLLYASDGIKSIYGISAEDAYEDIFKINKKVHKEDEAKLRSTLATSAENMNTWVCEWRVKQSDGSYTWVRGQGAPERQADGTMIWDAVLFDISETKAAQQAERKIKDQFETIVNSVSGIIWEGKPNLDVTYISKQAESVTGYTSSHWYKEGFWKAQLHPDERDKVIKLSNSKFRKKEGHQFEYRFKHAKGRYIWVRNIVNYLKSSKGIWILQGIMLDITKEKESEIRQKELDNKYRYLAENTSDIISVQNMNMKYTFVSESIKRVLGYDADELLGKNEKKFIWKKDHSLLNKVASLSTTSDDEIVLEYRMLKKNGEVRWFRVTKKMVADETSSFPQVVSSYTDITEKKKAELELIKNEEQFRLLAENTSDAVVLFNPDLSINYVSPGTTQIFGYSPSEYARLDHMKQVFPDDRHIASQTFEDTQKSGDEITREYRMFNKQKDVIWVENRTQVIRNKSNISQIVSTINDITQRKLAEIKKEEALNQLRLAVSSANLGIWQYEYKSKKLDVNERLLQMFDIDSNAFDGKKTQLKNQIHPEDQELFVRAMEAIKSGESVNDIRLRVNRKDGIGHISASGSPLLNEKGHVIGRIGVNLDITDIVDRKNELRRKIHQLEIATKTAKMGLFTKSLTNERAEFNDELLNIYEVTSEEVAYDKHFWENMVFPEDRIRAIDGFKNLNYGPKKEQSERFRIRTKSGKTKHVYAAGTTVETQDGTQEVIGVNMDVSDLVENEEKLEEALREKDVLIKELHHRVKNNLQMVSSILHIKSRTLKETESKILTKDINSKIISIAQVHESLLKQGGTDRLYMKEYITDLIKNLTSSFYADTKKFECSIEVKNYLLESELVFTIGLIIHEIVSNIIKYAYEQDEIIIILLTFNKKGGNFSLVVEDLGKGINNEQNLKKTTGMALIHSLVETINGNITLHTKYGVKYEIEFPTLKSKINQKKYT